MIGGCPCSDWWCCFIFAGLLLLLLLVLLSLVLKTTAPLPTLLLHVATVAKQLVRDCFPCKCLEVCTVPVAMLMLVFSFLRCNRCFCGYRCIFK